MHAIFGFERRRVLRFCAAGLVLGLLLGIGLGSFGLMPIPDLNVRWTLPAAQVGANGGIQQYVYGEGDLAGEASTPQVIVLSRRLKIPPGQVSIGDERVLVRKVGLDKISEWAGAGAPVLLEDGGQQ